MSAELQAEYDAKMAEYYDYENYEENYMAYGYDYSDEVVTDPCNDGTHNCNALASCISGRLENILSLKDFNPDFRSEIRY